MLLTKMSFMKVVKNNELLFHIFYVIKFSKMEMLEPKNTYFTLKSEKALEIQSFFGKSF